MTNRESVEPTAGAARTTEAGSAGRSRTNSATRRTGAAAAAVVLGAALTAGSALLRWAQAQYVDDLRGSVPVSATGAELIPALIPLAVASLAALGAVLAVRGIARQVLGVLLAVLGLLVGWLGATGFGSGPMTDTLPSGARAATVTVAPFGPVVAILGGLFVLAAGTVVAGTRTRRRALGARYERAGSGTTGDPMLDMWKALDADRDPTVDGPERSAGPSAPPSGGAA